MTILKLESEFKKKSHWRQMMIVQSIRKNSLYCKLPGYRDCVQYKVETFRHEVLHHSRYTRTGVWHFSVLHYHFSGFLANKGTIISVWFLVFSAFLSKKFKQLKERTRHQYHYPQLKPQLRLSSSELDIILNSSTEIF